MRILLAPDSPAGGATATIEQPTTEETKTRKTAMGNWMTGLKTELPNPSMAGNVPPKPDGETPPKPASAAAPAQPAAAAPPTPKPEDEQDEKWPRSADDWKNYKSKEKERRGKLQEKVSSYEARIKELENKPQVLNVAESEEYKSLKAQHDELSDRLRTVDVQQHPRFQTYFQSQIDAQVEIAKGLVDADSRERIATVIQSPDSPWRNSQLEELVDNLGPLEQSRLGGVLNKLDEINREKKAEIAKSKELFDQMKAQETKTRDTTIATIRKIVDDALAHEAKKETGNFVWQSKEGDDAWNKQVSERVAFVKDIFQGKNQERIPKLIIDGTAYPMVLAHAEAVWQENEKLKAQVAELTKAAPRVEGTRTVTAPNGNGNPEPNRQQLQRGTNPHDAVKGWVGSFTKQMQEAAGG